ncbi:MAG: hypothetical protein A2544_02370 [Candidatus Zambryskibacteria bacterium RIFOXYD2_FULL_43_10]|uniref:Uncharacterized protein n=1 Tax=Candidatus Zambryskibacteria bacterium RIFOXYD2_FULL_43_10 TaxID=1802782 RepID=A0A1G2V7L9_9BACT|nr:MAG: hypothetical protein A2544_02370 [Candidatus Zambryskibacteria bacterium RIFOXYD2_FULL_43_10]
MKRILLSLGMIVFIGAVVAGATGAFFSDTETSSGNTFAAGELDLKIDSESHFNHAVCTNAGNGNPGYRWIPNGADPTLFDTQEEYNVHNVANPDLFPPVGTACSGTWAESDLVPNQPQWRFFNFGDLKPGDEGENTISLHVYDNDAWGRMLVGNVVNADNDCTEPEDEAMDEGCTQGPGEGLTGGELGANLTFHAWLDQGAILGFQCNDSDSNPDGARCTDDSTEGDNIWQCTTGDTPTHQLTPEEYSNLNDQALVLLLQGSCDEPLVIEPGTVDDTPNPIDETHNIWPALTGYRAVINAQCAATDANGDGQTSSNPATIPYGVCQGIAVDGRLVGSTTYYFGLAWEILDTVGNIIQTDSLVADLIFEVEQHRNNPNPFTP